MAITIDHGKPCRSVWIDGESLNHNVYDYIIGIINPHYPMPAIPLQVFIGSYQVAILSNSQYDGMEFYLEA